MRSRSGKKRQPQPGRGQSPGKATPARAASRPRSHPPTRAPKPPQGGYFLWGRHAVFAALANPDRRIATLYATESASAELTDTIAGLPAARRTEIPPPQGVDRTRLDALHAHQDGDKAVHQGLVAAVWPLEAPDLAAYLDSAAAANGHGRQRLLLLDQLSDPRNVGAIMRSALALGADAIITTNRHAPEESGALARAAAGALERVPLIRVVNLARAIEQLQDSGVTVAGLAADGDLEVDRLAAIDRLAIVLGAEGSGLRHLTRQHCDSLVRIDISPDSESLNVSIAAAIALYAASRA